MPDWEAALGGQLKSSTSAGWQVFCFEEVSSTMDAARQLLKSASAQLPLAVMAAVQTKGRGRLGRRWLNSKGSLSLTAALPVESASQADFSSFTLVVGTVLQTFFAEQGCSTGLKWPNDILANKAKLAGVLVEKIQLENQGILLVGIGANLVEAPELPSTTALALLGGKQLSPVAAAGVILPALQEAFSVFSESGFTFFKSTWLENALYLNQQVTMVAGGRNLTGTFKGISDQGHMLLEQSGKIEAFSCGDIEVG